MDVVNIKISKLGGLTRARQVRDLCVSLGIAMTIEDSWGGDIVTAAISHLAHSTPTEFLFTSTDFNSYVTVSIADEQEPRPRIEREARSLGRLFGGEDFYKSIGERREAISGGDVLVQRCRVVLRQHEHANDIRVDAIRDRHIDQTILAAERHRRLRAIFR